MRGYVKQKHSMFAKQMKCYTESSSLDMLTKKEITWGMDYAKKSLAEPLWRIEMYQVIMILISAFLRLCEEYKNLKKELYSSSARAIVSIDARISRSLLI